MSHNREATQPWTGTSDTGPAAASEHNASNPSSVTATQILAGFEKNSVHQSDAFKGPA